MWLTYDRYTLNLALFKTKEACTSDIYTFAKILPKLGAKLIKLLLQFH